MEVLNWLAQRSSHLKRQFDEFYGCQSMSQVVTGCSFQPWEFIASHWYCLPQPGRQQTRWGIAAGVRIPLGFRQSIINHSVNHNFSGWKSWFWPSEFEFTTFGCFWENFSLACWQVWQLKQNGEWYISCPFKQWFKYTFDLFLHSRTETKKQQCF